jgi:hypothetical protein
MGRKVTMEEKPEPQPVQEVTTASLDLKDPPREEERVAEWTGYDPDILSAVLDS